MSDKLDSIIDTLPISFYHYKLFLICGLAFSADAIEVSLLSFLSTCAGAEWHLSYLAQATITGVVFIGELAGGMFWGPFADRYGRRISFLLACFLMVVAGLLSGAAPSYEWLLFFRVIVGFGVGGLAVPFDLLAEFLPASRRGKFLMYIEYFWTLGSLFVTGVAWVMLSSLGWRGLTYVAAIPVAISSITGYFFLPESPRWLVVKGRIAEAEKILREAASANGDIHSHALCLAPGRDIEFPSHHENTSGKGVHVHKETFYYDLVRSPRMRQISLPLWIVWTSFGFTYYGVILFISRLYTEPAAHSDPGSSDVSLSCSFDYQSIFVNASAELLGVFVTSIIVDEWGRTRTQSVLYALGGAAVLCMGMKLPLPALGAVSLLARLCAMGASCATWVATPELYPTEMRATGHSVCSSLARVGAFVAPYFVVSDVSPFTVGIVLAAGNVVAAAIAGFLLPETNGVELHAGISDAPIALTPVSSSAQLVNPPNTVEDESMVWTKSLLHYEEEETKVATSNRIEDVNATMQSATDERAT